MDNNSASLVSETQQGISQKSERLVWIDWMKTLGMGAIVYGHFAFQNPYVYTFSVPLFFLISGFLNKIEIQEKVFWRKQYWNLIVPMILICLCNYLMRIIISDQYQEITLRALLKQVGLMLAGMYDGVREMWFVYTLILLKIVHQYVHKPIVVPVLVVISIIISFILINYDPLLMGKHIFKLHSAYLSVFISYPFFIAGMYLKKWKGWLSSVKMSYGGFALLLLSVFLIVFCGDHNGVVYMVNHEYGKSLFFFFLGGISGSVCIYILSRHLNTFMRSFAKTISIGSIVVLGFHMQLIVLNPYGAKTTFSYIIFTVIILLLFVPIIIVVKKYLPWMMGSLRVNNK